jgi:hypothetical protein
VGRIDRHRERERSERGRQGRRDRDDVRENKIERASRKTLFTRSPQSTYKTPIELLYRRFRAHALPSRKSASAFPPAPPHTFRARSFIPSRSRGEKLMCARALIAGSHQHQQHHQQQQQRRRRRRRRRRQRRRER